MHDLDTLQRLIVKQAVDKGWKQDAMYCIRRTFDELKELEEAIQSNKPAEVIAVEAIDCLYFILQAIENKAPEISMNDMFDKKYYENWSMLKKTEDENGSKVLR